MNPNKTFRLSFFFGIVLILFVSPGYSQKVSFTDIESIAKNTYYSENRKEAEISSFIPLVSETDTCVYIAKYKSGGFAIIASHYAADPMLGYCKKGEYKPGSMPGGLEFLIEGYVKSISSLFKNKTLPESETQELWNIALSDFGRGAVAKSAVSPILSTEWQQGDYHQSQPVPYQDADYNRDCPDGCLAGCGAVAMAQVLYHWKWDVNQSGSNTFDGETVNFGNSYHCYGMMNEGYSDAHNSKLIYQAGVSCNTNYCANGYISGTSLANIVSGFITYWGMNPGAHTTRRLWIMIPSWKNRLKDELDSDRPVVYAGGDHFWVIDGYNSSNNFHCNWGLWDGIYDDYFSLGDFTPFDRDYDSNEWAIFDLYPATTLAYAVSGPETLTGQSTQYDILNTADCIFPTWTVTPNIQVVYGGYGYLTVKAISGGIGWLDAKYVIDGVTYWAPRKYVTCLP